MALSRIGSAAFAAVLIASPAWAQDDPARDAIDAQQQEVHDAIFSCGVPVGNEIIVCGNQDDLRGREDARYRLDPTPREGERAGGSQRRALDADSSRCTAVGRSQQCTRGLDVVKRRF